MEIKHYRATTEKEGVMWARNELGPEAVVLSTKSVPRLPWLPWIGGRQVEMTVATPGEVSVPRPDVPESTTPRIVDPSVTELVARLRAGNVDDDLAFEIASAIPPTRRRGLSYDGLIKALAERFQPLVAPDVERKPVEVFVGPPGVGKTTTIAKIAAQTRARTAGSLGLIAADGYRVGAVEQLRLYADIIGSPLTVATTASELEFAVSAREQAVLVDTAGRPPHDQATRDLFRTFSTRQDVRTHLVLDAGQSTRQLRRIVTAYRSTCPDRIVVTKLDQTDSMGALLRVLRETRIPVSFLGVGQQVPEDLRRATPTRFAALMLGEIPSRGDANE